MLQAIAHQASMLPRSPSPVRQHAISGHAKRKKRNEWPKPMWIYAPGADDLILGAALFTSATSVAHDDTKAEVDICRAVQLEVPLRVTQDHCKFKSSVFALIPSVDLGLRQKPVIVGGSVCNHFLEHVSLPVWRVFTVRDTVPFHKSLQDPSLLVKMAVSASTIKHCGQPLAPPMQAAPPDNVVDPVGHASDAEAEPVALGGGARRARARRRGRDLAIHFGFS